LHFRADSPFNKDETLMRPRPVPTRLLVVCFVMGSLCGCGGRTAGEPKPEVYAPGQEVTVEEIQFRHGNNLLAGSLYRPGRPGRHPAVVLVLGSGAQDRAYGGAGPALGRHFAGSGFVCLAWDKPGVGRSTGDFNAQTFRDRAEESLAAVRFLRQRPDVRPDQVGLWGHSQGGMVAPLAASLSDQVAFVIEVSGWQGAAWRQDAVRVEAELRAEGFSEADVKEATAFARLRMDLIRGTGPYEELERAQEKVKGIPWFKAVHFCDRTLFDAARRVVEYDTGPSWEKVRCPVLVIYGDRDTSSGPPDELVATVRRGLTKAENRDVTVRIFAGADHSLCLSEAGGRKETLAKAAKGEAAPDFVPGYLDLMTTWLRQRFGP
jgi:pimeloyl-ACP methyl ester carboxylesterase